MMSLPVISCQGCGACCLHVGSPPGYAWDPFRQEANLPPELEAELLAYYDHCQETGDWRDGEPCCWYDQTSRSCRHYEHRPDVCREFEVGGEDCLRFRLTSSTRES